MQKAYGKQKMASEKSARTPAVLDFNTQIHRLALECTQRQDSAKPPPREWNTPRPTENETHMLAPNLNRVMTAGMDRVDVNAHLDDTGISHVTKRGLMRVNGRDCWTSQARLETQERKVHGNSMETPRESDKLTLEQSAQGIDERIHQDSKLTKLKLDPHTKDTTYFDSQKLMEMMMKEFFQRKEVDQKWEKKEKPDSAWLVVGREDSKKLNKSATENSTASPHSQSTANTLTLDGHETPPENPATELNTNSTPNTPDHSSVQQTPADETPQVPESTVLVVCHSSEEHQISSDILNVFSCWKLCSSKV